MVLKVLTGSDTEMLMVKFTEVFTAEPWFDDWSNTDQLKAYIADLTMQSNSLTLGYMDGDELTAAAMGRIKHWYTGTEYCVDEFFVTKKYQNRGVGSAFLKEIRKYLSCNGITHIFLQTDRTVPAYGFYLKNGFEEMEDIVSFAIETESGDEQ